MEFKVDKDSPNADAVNELLDKLILNQLHLMEEKIDHHVIIESKVHDGSIHLAKSRYIMGQTSVSTSRLPTESSPEFSASVHTEFSEEKQFQIVENSAENTVNPLKWFGILVPQNLHKAQDIFKNSVQSVVECASVQFQLYQNMRNMDLLKKYLHFLKSA